MVRPLGAAFWVLSLLMLSVLSLDGIASARDFNKVYTDQANDLVDAEGKPTTGPGFIDIMSIDALDTGPTVELTITLFPDQNIMESKDVQYGFLLTADADTQYYASYSNGDGRFSTPTETSRIVAVLSKPSALTLIVPADLLPQDDFELMAYAIMSEDMDCSGCVLNYKVVAQDVAGFYGGQPMVDAQTAAPTNDSACLGGIFLGGGLIAGLLVLFLTFGPLALKDIPGTTKHDEIMAKGQAEAERRATDGVMDMPGTANDPERSKAWSVLGPRERLALIKSLDMKLGDGTCQELAGKGWPELPGAVQDWLMEDMDLLDSNMARDVASRWAEASEPARRELLEEHSISGRISYRWAAGEWGSLPVEARLSILNSLRGKEKTTEEALAQVQQEVQTQYAAQPQNPYMRQAQEERYELAQRQQQQQHQQQRPQPQYQPQYQYQYQHRPQQPQQPYPAYPHPAYYPPYPYPAQQYPYPPNPYYPPPAYYQPYPQQYQYPPYQPQQQQPQPQPSRGDATRPAPATQMPGQAGPRKATIKKKEGGEGQ